MSPIPLSELMGSPLRVLALERLFDAGAGNWLDEPELARSVTALEDDVRACLVPLVRGEWLERKGADIGWAWRVADDRRSAVSKALETIKAKAPSLIDRLRRVQRGPMGEIVGYDPRLKMVFEKARIASRSQVPVLLDGESGTGKAIVARAIHDLGERTTRPFVSAHTLRLPEDGIEQLMRVARGGTMYLDGLGNLPEKSQRVLLEALTRMRLNPSGAESCRVLTGSEIPVRVLVADGRLSADLSRRIDVFRIRLPSLRERIDDLPMLAEQFRVRGSERRGVPGTTGFTDGAMERLTSHAWPGNLRELEGVVQAAALMAGGGDIAVEQIESALRPSLPAPPPRTPTRGPIVPLEDVIKAALLDALRRHTGNVTAAARELDISKVTLYRRLERFAPDPQAVLDGFRD